MTVPEGEPPAVETRTVTPELADLQLEYANLTSRADDLRQRTGFVPEFLQDDIDSVEEQIRNLTPKAEPTDAELAAEEARVEREAIQAEEPAQVPVQPTPEEPSAQVPVTPTEPVAETPVPPAPEPTVEEPAPAGDTEALKEKARQIARVNFNTALDQVDSADYNGDLDAALDAYRVNTLDTLDEEGLKDSPDWDYILGAAEREFARLTEEHKAKQAPAPADDQAILQKLEDEGAYYYYSEAVDALKHGDDVYAVDADDVFRVASTTKNLRRLTTPEEIAQASREGLELFGLETEAGNASRANKLMGEIHIVTGKQIGRASCRERV